MMNTSSASGSLLVIKPVSTMMSGGQAKIGVTVTNSSDKVWSGGGVNPFHLSYHWLKDSEEVLIFAGRRSQLPEGGVAPQQSLDAELVIDAPNETGSFILVLTLVQEHVGWLENWGFKAARLAVAVNPAPANEGSSLIDNGPAKINVASSSATVARVSHEVSARNVKGKKARNKRR